MGGGHLCLLQCRSQFTHVILFGANEAEEKVILVASPSEEGEELETVTFEVPPNRYFTLCRSDFSAENGDTFKRLSLSPGFAIQVVVGGLYMITESNPASSTSLGDGSSSPQEDAVLSAYQGRETHQTARNLQQEEDGKGGEEEDDKKEQDGVLLAREGPLWLSRKLDNEAVLAALTQPSLAGQNDSYQIRRTKERDDLTAATLLAEATRLRNADLVHSRSTQRVSPSFGFSPSNIAIDSFGFTAVEIPLAQGKKGLVISHVVPETPAARQGLSAGDRLISIVGSANNRTSGVVEVTTVIGLRQQLIVCQKCQSVTLQVLKTSLGGAGKSVTFEARGMLHGLSLRTW